MRRLDWIFAGQMLGLLAVLLFLAWLAQLTTEFIAGAFAGLFGSFAALWIAYAVAKRKARRAFAEQREDFAELQPRAIVTLAPAAQQAFTLAVEQDRLARTALLDHLPMQGELVTDPEVLPALPPATILIDARGGIWARADDSFHYPWSTMAIARFYTTDEMTEKITLPAKVLQ